MRLYTPISGWKRGMGWITASSQVPNRCSHTPSPPRPRRMEHWVTSTVYFTKDIPYIYILRFPKSWGTPKSSSHLTILGLKPVVLEIPHSPCIHIELNNLIISFDWTTQVPHWNAHPSMKRIGKKPGGAPQQLNQCGDSYYECFDPHLWHINPINMLVLKVLLGLLKQGNWSLQSTSVYWASPRVKTTFWWKTNPVIECVDNMGW